MKFFLSFLVLSFTLIICGCEEKLETSTKGSLTIYADESVYPLVKVQMEAFSKLYQEAKLSLIPVTAREGIVKIVNNEAEIFISSREFNDEEKSASQKNKLELKTLKFCYDGIAVITSYETFLDKIKFDEIKYLLQGRYKNATAVIPERNSGIFEYLQSSVMQSEKLSNVEIALHEADVIDLVKKNKNKIGFVGFNLLNDSSGVKILNVGLREQSGVKDVFLEPHPGYFVQKLYPLSRMILIYVNEINIGLASGFATYLTGNEGQKLVLENNLGPAAVPVRIISN
ncbi:MAG: substrate-binding domain-containing protein [Ignavibacteriaceae bacterium]|nr:substrate-binding domain-containing protein [Ignavibacteriaceae bacterium]